MKIDTNNVLRKSRLLLFKIQISQQTRPIHALTPKKEQTTDTFIDKCP